MNRPTGYRALTRRLGVAAALAGVLCAVACDGDDAAAVSGGGSPKTEVTFAITGAVTVTGSAHATPPTDNGTSTASCAEYAKGGTDPDDGETHFVLPRDIDAPVGGKKLFVGALIKDYTGPGRYPRKNLTDQGSPPGIDIDGTLYLQLTGSTSEVTTDGKGGGTWTFTGLVVRDPDGTDGNNPINGTVKWTCAD